MRLESILFGESLELPKVTRNSTLSIIALDFPLKMDYFKESLRLQNLSSDIKSKIHVKPIEIWKALLINRCNNFNGGPCLKHI